MSNPYKGGHKASNARWYAKNREVQHTRMKERREFIKDCVYQAYGGYVCACCGETIKQFLTIDHINNDGSKHRREIGNRGGIGLYYWLVEHNFPPGFQVLCRNCNSGRYLNGGICPHKDTQTMAKMKANPLGLLMMDVVSNDINESDGFNLDKAPSFRSQVPVKEGIAGQDTFKQDAKQPSSRAPVELRRMHLAGGEGVGEGSEVLKGSNMYDEFGGGTGKSAGEFTANKNK